MMSVTKQLLTLPGVSVNEKLLSVAGVRASE